MDVRELSVDEIDEVSGGSRGAVLREVFRSLRRRAELLAQQIDELINGDDEEE